MATKTVFIKMKPYLKEFILGLEDKDGNKLYGPEPVRFSKKDMIYRLIDKLRRVPGDKSTIIKPIDKSDTGNFLAVKIETFPTIKNDDLRLFLCDESMSKISSHVYDIFSATLYEYVNEHLLWQKKTFLKDTPSKNFAYRSFCTDFNLTKIDDDSLRKALDRRGKDMTEDVVRKKMASKKNIYTVSSLIKGNLSAL